MVLLQETWELLMLFKIFKRDMLFTPTFKISSHIPLLYIKFLDGALIPRKAYDMSSEA